MSEYTLFSDPPLAGTNLSIGDVLLKAPKDMALVSIALPLGSEAAAEKAIASAYSTALPAIGKTAAAGDATLMRLGPDQAFVLFPHPTPDAEREVAGKLKGAAYTTDQTDVWCVLDVSGPDSRTALERICPLDLHDSGFAVGDVARTAMEHLGVIITRTGPDSWRLLSASSSAGSFLHAVEASAKNIN